MPLSTPVQVRVRENVNHLHVAMVTWQTMGAGALNVGLFCPQFHYGNQRYHPRVCVCVTGHEEGVRDSIHVADADV